MKFKDEFDKRISYINSILNKYMPISEGYQEKIFESMHYSIMAGGKRIRPILINEVNKLFGGKTVDVEPFMAAIEMIHTYSLVHDDLPAMDDDDYRRGKKTTHKVYGEAMGILTGDALLNYSFEILTKALINSVDPYSFAKAMNILSIKAGVHGMIGGQVVDVSSEGETVSLDKLNFIYRLKTSALIEAAMMIGAVLAGADSNEVNVIEETAGEIGLAFQIKDDILDVMGSTEEIGKPLLSDNKNNKTTYITLFGVEKAEAEVKKLTTSAMSKLKSINKDNEFLNELIFNLIYRKK